MPDFVIRDTSHVRQTLSLYDVGYIAAMGELRRFSTTASQPRKTDIIPTDTHCPLDRFSPRNSHMTVQQEQQLSDPSSLPIFSSPGSLSGVAAAEVGSCTVDASELLEVMAVMVVEGVTGAMQLP